MKICLVGDSAPLYRLSIYQAMRKEFNCDFILARSTNTKQFNENALDGVRWVEHRRVFNSRVYYQPTAIRKSYSYDVLVLDCGMFCLSEWVTLILSKIRGKRTFLWTHGWYGRETLIKKIIKRFNFFLCSGVFLYGYYARELMLKENYDARKLFVIHNSLDYDHQLHLRQSLCRSNLYKNHFGNDSSTIIFIGRLTAVKRLDLLIEALTEMKQRGKKYNLVIVGDGVMRANLQDTINESKLCNQVWMYGECYDEVVNSQLIYNADLCVSPGNVGLTAIHSMMYGTPVITHNDFTHQMPEFEAIRPGITGSFFKYQDVHSLADCIIEWFDNTDRESVRQSCFKEIDTQWTPSFEISIMKSALQ